MKNIISFEILFFCVAIQVLMLFKVKYGVYRVQHQKLFGSVLCLAILSTGLDFLTMIIEGQRFPFDVECSVIGNVGYFVVTVMLGFYWLWYSGYVLQLPFWNDKKKLFWYAIPMGVAILFSVLTVWNGLIFEIDDFNWYHRGILYYVLYVPICYFYIFAGMFVSLRRALLKRFYADRSLYWSVASYGLFSVVAIILQMYYDDELPVCSAGITLSTFFAFIVSQAYLISVDPLTRLNNRNQLNHFLASKMDKITPGKRLYLFVLDLDKFKGINDTFGHSEGDNALCIVASVLKSVCGPRGHFMARFGGDEFNVIAELDDDTGAIELCESIHGALTKKSVGLPYELKVSIGFVDNIEGTESIPDFFSRADKKLYEAKRRK